MSPEDAGRSGPVEIRAFRGKRRASVYREHVVAEAPFLRIVAAGERHGLDLLSSLDPRRVHELDKRAARRLAGQATSLRMTGELPELDDDLTAIAEVAGWCARASESSWLRVCGRA
jgi:hypothetical protein